MAGDPVSQRLGKDRSNRVTHQDGLRRGHAVRRGRFFFVVVVLIF